MYSELVLFYFYESILIPKSILERNLTLPETDLVSVSKMEFLKIAEEYALCGLLLYFIEGKKASNM